MTREECIDIEHRYKEACDWLSTNEKNAIYDCLVHARTESNYEEVVPTIFVKRLIADLYDLKIEKEILDEPDLLLTKKPYLFAGPRK